MTHPHQLLLRAGLPLAPAERLAGGDVSVVHRCGAFVVKTAPGASMSAPPSSSASSTATSSLLAAQCSGVSAAMLLFMTRAFGSAPAAINTPTVSAPFGK